MEENVERSAHFFWNVWKRFRTESRVKFIVNVCNYAVNSNSLFVMNIVNLIRMW